MSEDLTPDLARMREAAKKATPGDLDTIPKPNSEYGGYDSGHYECPACGGCGEVKGETFTNFDGVALGVQFFGIGNEFKAYEEFFRAANPSAVLYLLDRIAELEGEIERWRAGAASAATQNAIREHRDQQEREGYSIFTRGQEKF